MTDYARERQAALNADPFIDHQREQFESDQVGRTIVEILEDLEKEKKPMTEQEEFEQYVTECLEYFRESKKAGIAMAQRRFRWGYIRAAKVVGELERRKLVGPSNGVEFREVF